MKTISASDANRSFSSLLREVAAGTSITILSRHKPVATIVPVRRGGANRQRAARTRLLQRLRSQPGARCRWNRDELYQDA